MLCFRNFPETTMFMVKRAGDQDFNIKVFCLEEPENLAGNPSVLCFRKFPSRKSSWKKMGSIKIFRHNLFNSRCLKFL